MLKHGKVQYLYDLGACVSVKCIYKNKYVAIPACWYGENLIVYLKIVLVYLKQAEKLCK